MGEGVVDSKAEADPRLGIGREERHDDDGEEFAVAQGQSAGLRTARSFCGGDQARQVERSAVARRLLAVEKHPPFERHEHKKIRVNPVARILHGEPHGCRIVGADAKGLLETVIVGEQPRLHAQLPDPLVFQSGESARAGFQIDIDLPQGVASVGVEHEGKSGRLKHDQQGQKDADQPTAQRAKPQWRPREFHQRFRGIGHPTSRGCGARGTPA